MSKKYNEIDKNEMSHITYYEVRVKSKGKFNILGFAKTFDNATIILRKIIVEHLSKFHNNDVDKLFGPVDINDEKLNTYYAKDFGEIIYLYIKRQERLEFPKVLNALCIGNSNQVLYTTNTVILKEFSVVPISDIAIKNNLEFFFLIRQESLIEKALEESLNHEMKKFSW